MILRQEVCVTLYGFTEENQWKKIDNLSVCSVRQPNNTSLMNELPVIGSSRKDFWDRHGANIATRQKDMYDETLFRRPKKTILERDQRFFAEVLSQMIDVDAREVQFFIRITTKYVTKYIDKLLSLRHTYPYSESQCVPRGDPDYWQLIY